MDEYWIVDGQQRQVQVYRRAEGHLSLAATLSGDASIETPLLPGFSLPIARLWPPAL